MRPIDSFAKLAGLASTVIDVIAEFGCEDTDYYYQQLDQIIGEAQWTNRNSRKRKSR